MVDSGITKLGPGGGGIKPYIILFISHLFICYVSKWITDFFRKLQVNEDLVNSKEKLDNVPSKSFNWFTTLKKL